MCGKVFPVRGWCSSNILHLHRWVLYSHRNRSCLLMPFGLTWISTWSKNRSVQCLSNHGGEPVLIRGKQGSGVEGVDGHTPQFGDSDWLSMVEYSNYNMLAQQPEVVGEPNTVETAQWNYIQTLEQKVAYLEHELNLARAQLIHRSPKTCGGRSLPKADSRSPDAITSVERSPPQASEEDETPESSNGSVKRRKYVRKPRVSDWTATEATLED